MIAFLSGKIISVIDGQIILKIPSGIGYLVNVYSEYLVNENLEIFIWQTENGLFGFETFLQRNWAESLGNLDIKVSTAAEIVWKMGGNKISQALIYRDSGFFENFQINPKTINKIFQVFGSDTQEDVKENGKESFEESQKAVKTKKEIGKNNLKNLKNVPKTQERNEKNSAEISTETLAKSPTESSIWQKVTPKNIPEISNSAYSESISKNPVLPTFKNVFVSNSKKTTNVQNKAIINHSANFGKNSQSGILSVDFTQKMTTLGHGRGDIVSSITMLKSQNSWENVSLENLVEKAEKLLKNAKIKNEKLF